MPGGRARLLLATMVALAAACGAHRASPATQAQRIEGQVWSPYCPGRLLIDCPTAQADALRARIVRELSSGRTGNEVLRELRHDFGDAALARPAEGPAGLVLWLVPGVVFVLGSVLLALLVRRSRRRVPPRPKTPSASPNHQAGNTAELRDEVRREI